MNASIAAATERVPELTVEIPTAEVTDGLARFLRRVLVAHPGDVPVVIRLTGTAPQRSRLLRLRFGVSLGALEPLGTVITAFGGGIELRAGRG